MGNIINRIGEIHITNEGYKVEIIEYFGVFNCSIKFENGNVLKNIRYNNIKNGVIRNQLHKTFKGIGYIGYGPYKSRDNGKLTNYYKTWSGMISRCYSEKCQLRQPTYKGCNVYSDWHNFQIFAKWFDENYIDGYELDKDILIKGNKVYGPDTCCFVPHSINSLMIKNDINRGDWPLGVSWHKQNKKFTSQCNINDKPKLLGYLETSEEAWETYKIAKENEIKRIANKYKSSITNECYQALIMYKVEIID